MKTLQNSQENICARISFLAKLQLYQEITLALELSCEPWLTFKNTYFIKYLRLTASICNNGKGNYLFIYCYIQSENDKILKFHIDNFSYFWISKKYRTTYKRIVPLKISDCIVTYDTFSLRPIISNTKSFYFKKMKQEAYLGPWFALQINGLVSIS